MVWETQWSAPEDISSVGGIFSTQNILLAMADSPATVEEYGTHVQLRTSGSNEL